MAPQGTGPADPSDPHAPGVWANAFDDTTRRDLGAILYGFLQHWSRWVERRVESVTFPDEATVRRRVSVDFTIPSDWKSPLPLTSRGPVFCVPLALLRKQGLTHFDLRDESRAALPLLTRDQNGILAQATLGVLAEKIRVKKNPSLPDRLPDEIRNDLAMIANGPENRALVVLAALGKVREDASDTCVDWREMLSEDDKFMALAHDFSVAFPLIVPVVGQQGERRIVKFSYEATAPPGPPGSKRRRLERGLGWRPRTEKIDVPAIGQCRCYHLECVAPEGLQVTRGKLSSSEPPAPTVWRGALPDVVKSGSERIHLHISAPEAASGTAYLNLRPHPSTITRAAWVAAGMTTVGLALLALRKDALVTNPGPAVGLLLLVPTALSTWVARPREPLVTTGLLLGQRLLSLACALCSVVAATLLVAAQDCSGMGIERVCKPSTIATAGFWVLCGLAAITWATLSRALYLVKRPPEKEGLV